MKLSRWTIVSGTIVLAVLLLLVFGIALAQEPEPNGDINEPSEIEAVTAVHGAVPIQGRLTDADGNPLTGSYSIRARLYDASIGGTALCSDTDTVVVDNGLFIMYLDGADGCSSTDIDGKQLYLGITVGSDTEMAPRQGIYPVPYAYSLRPGAVISDTTSSAIVHIENWGTSGRGLRSYAMSETGTNYGVVGASRSRDGYGGYFYANQGGIGVYGSATSTTFGGAGVEGESYVGSGVWGHSTTHDGVYAEGGYAGVYAETTTTDNNYGLYTPDNIHFLSSHLMGATMQVVQNAGKETLELGDVVAFNGMSDPLEVGGPPVIQVVGVTEANSTAVAGVVYSRYNIETVTAEADPAHAFAVREITSEGAVAPGEYLLVVIQGPAQVKASALGGGIQPGDLLSSAAQTGYAGKAAEININGLDTPLPGTILGKALEPLETGQKLIYIFVTLQ